MKWVFIAIGVIAGIIVLIASIGALLPAEHTAVQSAKFKQTRQDLWAVLTDFAAMASWNTAYTEVKRLPDRNGNAAWSLIGNQGPMPLEVTEMDTARKLVTRVIDEGMPFGGTWTYELTDTNDGTVLKITENGFIRNVIFRFMARFIFGYHATMANFLTDLGRRFHEEVTFVDPT